MYVQYSPVLFFAIRCRLQLVSPMTTLHLMRMRASSEKHIAGVPPHVTFLWLAALPKADALMKAYVPKCVRLMLAIVKMRYS